MIAPCATLVAIVSVALVAAAGLTVAATATATKNGLPAYTDGYATWRKLNRKPITTPGAHNGDQERLREQAPRRRTGAFRTAR